MTVTGDLLDRVAAEFGTPCYVYDLAEVRAAHRALAAGLPEGAGLLYSAKANPHPAVIAALGELGCGAEVSSVGELGAALAAGVRPEDCLYTGPGKTLGEVAWAIEAGVHRFSVDSPRDLGRVGRCGAAAGVVCRAVLRVNPSTGAPGAGLAMSGEASPFGADATWIAAHPDEFTHPFVDVCGFHVFLATNLMTAEAVLAAAEVSLAALEPVADALGVPVELLDLGGGFGHPFARPGERPDLGGLRAPLVELLAGRPAGLRDGRVVFESGRYLAGACGRLVSRVQDVKCSHGRTFAVLDSGIHHLGGMYGLRRVPSLGVEVVAHRPPGPAPDAEPDGSVLGSTVGPVDLVGPLCTPLDSWARGADLGPIESGDLVVVPNVGAYGLTASLVGFLSRPCPVEVVVDGDVVVEASRLALERVPHRAGGHRGDAAMTQEVSHA